MASQGLADVFKTHASFGTRQTSTELDGAKFVKIFKDCGLVGKGLSSTELDIIFSKVCGTRAVMSPYHGLAGAMRKPCNVAADRLAMYCCQPNTAYGAGES